MAQSKAIWSNLPAEIRYQILYSFLGEGCGRAASVSREWQAVIEPFNFSRISLTPSRLLDPILHLKRSLVRYIWFRVELQQYDCTMCVPDRQTWGLSNRENTFIKDAVSTLFETLSQWEANGELMLDISIYSPSDPEHWFKYLDFVPDVPPGEITPPLDYDAPHDPIHGWVDGGQGKVPHMNAIEKVFDEIMCEGPFDEEEAEMEWWRNLPLVPAVTSILLRQQTRRRWKPTALANMLPRFPNLREISYEPWREWSIMQRTTDRGNETLIQSLASLGHLRNLVVFENFNQQYPSRFLVSDRERIVSHPVAENCVRASVPLETLSVSFMVDARCFFHETALQTSWRWRNLTALALTSGLLDPHGRAVDIQNMLKEAAAAALRMPKLETMEIWNGRKGLAMLFRYQKGQNGQPAVITLRGTFDLLLGVEVVRAWRGVAVRQGSGEVERLETRIDARKIGSHGDAIVHLGLSAQVIRPVSLQQILKEHHFRLGPD